MVTIDIDQDIEFIPQHGPNPGRGVSKTKKKQAKLL